MITNFNELLQVGRAQGGTAVDEIIGVAVAEGKGENAPQGPSIFYDHGTADSLAHNNFELVEGNPLGHVNRTDFDRALQTITHMAAFFENNFPSKRSPYFAVGVKHGNACGASYGGDQETVLRKMLEGNLKMIFGGFVMTNFAIDEDCASVLLQHKKPEGRKRRKLAGVVAPSFNSAAVDLLKNKKRDCMLVANGTLAHLSIDSLDKSPHRTYVRGGHLTQKNYLFVPDLRTTNTEMFRIGTITESEMADLLLAGAVCVTSNSNTITLAKDGMIIGNGSGQMSRVIAARLALMIAEDGGHDPEGSMGWSDSFFPFPDAPEILLQAGVEAVFTTSGSDNDHLTKDLFLDWDRPLLMLPDSIARGFFGHGC